MDGKKEERKGEEGWERRISILPTKLTFHIKQQKNEMKRVMKEVRNAISIGTYGYLSYFRVL